MSGYNHVHEFVDGSCHWCGEPGCDICRDDIERYEANHGPVAAESKVHKPTEDEK